MRENASTEASTALGGHRSATLGAEHRRVVEGAASRGYSSRFHTRRRSSPHRERPEPVQLVAPDLWWRIKAHRNSVHETVSTQCKTAHSRQPPQPLIDRTAVSAGEPREFGRTAGGRPKADDAEVMLRDTSAPHHFKGWSLAPAGLPQPGTAGPRGTGRESARTECARKACECVGALRIGRADFLFIHVLAIPAAPPSAPPLARLRVPALPLGHRAVVARLPGRRARYPEQSSARELAQVIAGLPDKRGSSALALKLVRSPRRLRRNSSAVGHGFPWTSPRCRSASPSSRGGTCRGPEAHRRPPRAAYATRGR